MSKINKESKIITGTDIAYYISIIALISSVLLAIIQIIYAPSKWSIVILMFSFSLVFCAILKNKRMNKR